MQGAGDQTGRWRAAGWPPVKGRPSRFTFRGEPRWAIYPPLTDQRLSGGASARRSGSAGEGPAWHSPRLRNLFRSLARPSPSARPAARPRKKFLRAITHGRRVRSMVGSLTPIGPLGLRGPCGAALRFALCMLRRAAARGTRAWPEGRGGLPASAFRSQLPQEKARRRHGTDAQPSPWEPGVPPPGSEGVRS